MTSHLCADCPRARNWPCLRRNALLSDRGQLKPQRAPSQFPTSSTAVHQRPFKPVKAANPTLPFAKVSPLAATKNATVQTTEPAATYTKLFLTHPTPVCTRWEIVAMTSICVNILFLSQIIMLVSKYKTKPACKTYHVSEQCESIRHELGGKRTFSGHTYLNMDGSPFATGSRDDMCPGNQNCEQRPSTASEKMVCSSRASPTSTTSTVDDYLSSVEIISTECGSPTLKIPKAMSATDGRSVCYRQVNDEIADMPCNPTTRQDLEMKMNDVSEGTSSLDDFATSTTVKIEPEEEYLYGNAMETDSTCEQNLVLVVPRSDDIYETINLPPSTPSLRKQYVEVHANEPSAVTQSIHAGLNFETAIYTPLLKQLPDRDEQNPTPLSRRHSSFNQARKVL